MIHRRVRRVPLWAALAALVVGGAVGVPSPANAASPILPGNEGDVGVYTDGQNHAMEIGDPAYSNVGDVANQLKPGVPFTAGNMHQSIFEKDLAAGGTDYYLDRVLGVPGTIGSAVLMTRGRSLYMRGASNNNFTSMGFAGSAYVGGPNNLGNLYTVTVPGQTVTEVNANRFNAPSHARTRYTIGTTASPRTRPSSSPRTTSPSLPSTSATPATHRPPSPSVPHHRWPPRPGRARPR